MSVSTSASLGILGKHPGFGDFIRHGVSQSIADGLMGWMDSTLSTVRSDMDDGWERFWDNAQGLRFWAGRGVAGRTLAGCLRPSRDKVGRRYPFLLLAEGAAVASPLVDPDQRLYETLEAGMDAMTPGGGARTLLDGLDLETVGLSPEDDAERESGPLIWAHHPDGDLADLLAAAVPVDHSRAMIGRSYWWAPGNPGERAAVWLGQPGLPTAASLSWLLGGLPASSLGPETEVADVQQ
jgi:type VI secretion system protein ImpM